MNEIPVGANGEQRILVTPDVSIDFLGLETARVLSTPNMIMFMEMTSRNAIKPFLDSDHDSVGTVVNVKHLSAAPLGSAVRFAARVTEVNGRRVIFDVEAWSEDQKIGEGSHERAVINVAKFAARLSPKS